MVLDKGLMVLDNVLLVQIKESSCFAQLLEKIHVMNLELFEVRHVLVQIASRRGGGSDSTCGGARQHFEEGAAGSIRRFALCGDGRDASGGAIGRRAGAAVAQVAHHVLILVFIARIVLNGGGQIEEGGGPGAGDGSGGRVGSQIVGTRAFTKESIEVSVVEDAGNEVERGRAAGHDSTSGCRGSVGEARSEGHWFSRGGGRCADVNGVHSSGSLGTGGISLVVVVVIIVVDVGLDVADPADPLLGDCILLGVDIRRASRRLGPGSGGTGAATSSPAGFLDGLFALHLIGRSAAGNDADVQPFELVNDPFARRAGRLGRTPQLGELLGLLGLALGLGDGEGSEGNGTAGPLSTESHY